MNKTTKYMLISLIANSFLSIFKITFGFLSNTKSLIADGESLCSGRIVRKAGHPDHCGR